MEYDDDSVFTSVAVVGTVGGATHVKNNHTYSIVVIVVVVGTALVIT